MTISPLLPGHPSFNVAIDEPRHRHVIEEFRASLVNKLNEVIAATPAKLADIQGLDFMSHDFIAVDVPNWNSYDKLIVAFSRPTLGTSVSYYDGIVDIPNIIAKSVGTVGDPYLNLAAGENLWDFRRTASNDLLVAYGGNRDADGMRCKFWGWNLG